MSIPTNTGQRLTINNLKHRSIENLVKEEPFVDMEKPNWVSSSAVSKGVLVFLGILYTMTALFILKVSFIGASFKYGVSIAFVVGFFTMAAIAMVWFVIAKHRTIPKVWKLGIMVFEVLIMSFDVYVSASGWNLGRVMTLAENKAYERRDAYNSYYDQGKAVYSGIENLKAQAGKIAQDENKQNGGKGKICRIASTIDTMLSTVNFSRDVIAPEVPVFTKAYTLKDLNVSLTQYSDLFRSEENLIKADLGNAVGTLEAQKSLALEETELNEFQRASVRYLDKMLTTSIDDAKEVAAIQIPSPQISSAELNAASKDGIIMRMIAGSGLLFFLGLIAYLTWQRKRKRGAEDPYGWFERTLLVYYLRGFNIPLGYTDAEFTSIQLGSVDDDLIELLNNDTPLRTRLQTSGLTYRDLRVYYEQLGHTCFIRAFSGTGGWTTRRQIDDLIRDQEYGPMARHIIQTLTFNQFTEARAFRPDGGVADIISRSELSAGWYNAIIARTKNKFADNSQRQAFVDKFMSEGREDDDFYRKLIQCIDAFNASQLNTLSPQFVDALIPAVSVDTLTIFDTVDAASFLLYQNQWTSADSMVLQDMIARGSFTTLASLIEHCLRISPRLWSDIKREWKDAIRLAGRTVVPVNTIVVRDLTRTTDEAVIRTGLKAVFTV